MAGMQRLTHPEVDSAVSTRWSDTINGFTVYLTFKLQLINKVSSSSSTSSTLTVPACRRTHMQNNHVNEADTLVNIRPAMVDESLNNETNSGGVKLQNSSRLTTNQTKTEGAGQWRAEFGMRPTAGGQV